MKVPRRHLLNAAAAGFLAPPAPAQETAPKWVSEITFGPPWENVPERFRRLPVAELETPGTRAAWERQRVEIRRTLFDLLGDIPPRTSPPVVKTLSRGRREGCTVESFDLDNGVDSLIPGYLVIPDALRAPAPALLVLHWHSGDKDGVLFSGQEQNVLEPLIRRGYVLMAIDCYFNGDRLGHGPAGPAEKTIAAQRDSLFKLYLWMGRTLWGMMLRDDMLALDYLASRPEVDKDRIGATGMSMGSTGAWWLAALDERVKAVVGVACFTRYRELISAGQLRAHAIYYFVPGMLRHFDTEAVAGLVAPRALLALTGDRDPTSPPDGIRVLEQKLNRIYDLYGARERFRSVIFENTGHRYLPEMKQQMADWFDRWLKDRRDL